ncbi:polysaccharide biosynthesis/export family protein [Flavobacterium subsaxonicum]|nr:polysaccharide biosynthesis/export family protein [Flavobacterium subsaxonicum]
MSTKILSLLNKVSNMCTLPSRKTNSSLQMIKKIGLLIVIIFAFSSCAPRKKMAYFQNIADVSSDKLYETKLQADDLVRIMVDAPAPNQELAAPFNLTTLSPTASGGTSVTTEGREYLIDKNGEISMPLIGKVKLGGLTRDEALLKITGEISKYVTNPIINLRLMNFKVTVLGEVNSPGSYPIGTERITLPEALALAGDLQITGLRKNIMIIREVEGKKTYGFVDITNADFMNSEFYYLTQNDLVVVEPNRMRRNSSAIGRELSIVVSAVSLIVTIITFATR